MDKFTHTHILFPRNITTGNGTESEIGTTRTNEFFYIEWWSIEYIYIDSKNYVVSIHTTILGIIYIESKPIISFIIMFSLF